MVSDSFNLKVTLDERLLKQIYHGLDEYRSGVGIEVEFQEIEYSTYYKDITRELEKLQRSRVRRPEFDALVERLTSAGRYENPFA